VRLAAVAAVVAGVALLGAAPAPAQAAKHKRKTIRIFDNYFVPDAVKVRRGTTVTWKWPGFDQAGDVHDVKLKRGPKGVKKFHSEAASTDYSFKRKLRKPGKYRIVCTLHEEMRMTIRVRR
jgi:plastocyanin